MDAHTGALVIRKKMVEKIQMIGCAFLPIDKEKKKILISKRSMNKKYFPGFLEVIGGNLEFGEDFRDCIIREVKEEINCRIKDLQHLHSRAMYLNGLMYITIAYYGDLLDNPIFSKDEISEIKWISEEELKNYDFCPGDIELLKNLVLKNFRNLKIKSSLIFKYLKLLTFSRSMIIL